MGQIICIECGLSREWRYFRLNASHLRDDGTRKYYWRQPCIECKQKNIGLLENQIAIIPDISANKAAYLAGIVDGEGHIALAKRRMVLAIMTYE